MPALRRPAGLLLLGCVWMFCARVVSGDEAPVEPEAAPADDAAAAPVEAEPSLRDVDDEEAKPLADELGKAARKKESSDVLPALEAIADKCHASFLKPLLKMTTHENARVALRAGELLERRVGVDDLKAFWKSAWQARENRRRYGVRVKVVRAHARLEVPLDKRTFAEVADEWRWMLDNPQEVYGPALGDLCWAFGRLGEKRMATAMAKELDAPETGRGDLPDMPPDWWEKRYKQWEGMRPQAVAALRALTGRTFADTAAAKAWIEAEGPEHGIAWE